MKRSCIAAALLLAVVLLCACGRGGAGLPNPMRESSAEEILEKIGVELKAPEGAQDTAYSIISSDREIAQLRFTLNGEEYVCRAAKAEEEEDISGMNYEWMTEEWLDGVQSYSICFNKDAEGVIGWYDEETGVMRSVSISSGADEQALLAAAELVFPNETDAAGAETQKKLFDIFDEIRENCFPGTAGSSLKAAKYAAKLADAFAETGVKPSQAARLAEKYMYGLDEFDRGFFGQQLDGIISTFESIRKADGKGMLDDSGYESAYWPWSGGEVESCFRALPTN